MRIEWKEIPKEETIFKMSARYPDVKPKSLEVYLKLMWVTAQLERVLEDHFAEWGISRGRFMLLMMLYKGYCGVDIGLSDTIEGSPRPPGVMTPSELAANLDTTRGNMTGLIDGLEREGWIRREAHPEDRRGVFIVLTDEGRERIERMLPEHYRRMGLLLSKITTSESEAALAVVSRLVAGMAAVREDLAKAKPSETK